MIAPGGTAPIKRSRVMPPALPAANDKTKTPNRSSRFLTPATAPLSAKTKVPTRSSTSRRVSIAAVPLRTGRPLLSGSGSARLGALWRKPGARGDDQRLDTGLQGWMDNRGKARALIGRDLVEPARLLGFRVAVGVGAADKPEHGGRVPLRTERSKVLAGRRRSGLAHSVDGKVPAERVDDAPARRGIVDHQGIAVERRDLRRPGSARGGGLGFNDPLNRSEHALAHVFVEVERPSRTEKSVRL